MRPGFKIWRAVLDKYVEMRRDLTEKFLGSLSLEPPYSAPVTAVIHCYAKARFEKLYGPQQLIPQRTAVLMGSVFELAVKVLLEGYPPPHHYSYKVYRSEDGFEFTLHAAPDLVLDNEVVELKFTTAPLENLPMDHHEMQLKLYMNVYGMPGRLIYLTPSGVREYEYGLEEALPDGEVIKLGREFFLEKRSPRYEWECQYCPYRSMCPLAISKREQERT